MSRAVDCDQETLHHPLYSTRMRRRDAPVSPCINLYASPAWTVWTTLPASFVYKLEGCVCHVAVF